ncbi:hypothetical protein AMTR_s00043p00169930 [Amborella trichopoda]|uniref:Uncharacterized protein n=1 Tax=Amborella trichopoda TaxID=13333 RepID=W1PRW9_AMBTC|nr:hypothetical protein AMTR_s00043p00169930 [Amborella trichopoda]
MREGLVDVHYYDLWHAQHPLTEIQTQHVAHQARIAMWHRATTAGQGFGDGVGQDQGQGQGQGQGHAVMVWVWGWPTSRAWGDILEGNVGVVCGGGVGRGRIGGESGPASVQFGGGGHHGEAQGDFRGFW